MRSLKRSPTVLERETFELIFARAEVACALQLV
jgi:hypothetical protein